MSRDAVLLMAYGSPDNLDQVEAYYTDIRRGSPPPPELLEELIDRYRAIGGGSPLSRLVEAQRAALERELAARGRPMPVYAGMRHIAPRIGDVVGRRADDGAERFAAIALAPQRSSNGIGYRRAVEAALTARSVAGSSAPELRYVPSWHDEPRFVDALAGAVREALERFDHPAAVTVIFTAHSLPARVVAEGDVYPDEVRHTAELVARQLGLDSFEQAFQSAGRTGEPWLGPELLATLRRLAADGVRDVLVAPVGFVADHLEVLYDIDIEAKAEAERLGMHLERPRSMNDDPTFIAGLADVAARALDTPPEPAH
ncbi:MAG TPA: ferrochelatase [Candidatus Limnocylindrales bacterium]|nr:ferrochelatase [Candidatus Limnocylindrales bacterium]